MRAIGGFLAGLIAGIVVAILIGIVGVGFTFTLPARLNAGDTNALLDTLATMPTNAKLALAVAWLVGALAGAWTARRISGRAWPAWAVTLLIAGYVLLDTFVLPMAGWIQVLWILAPLVGGLLGNHLARGVAAPEAVATTTDEAPADL